jgi:nucleoside-diphosphate-sugar epimerase
MKVLVTGGLGFVGSNLVDNLRDVCKHEVTVIDNLCSESSSRAYMRPDVEYWIDDVRNMMDAKYAGQKFDVVYHLAALARIQPSFKDPLTYLSIDIQGTAAVCEYARKAGSRLVYAGSSSAYAGQFLNPYAFAKYTGEQVCQLYHEVYGMSTVVARFFNVYGRRQPTSGAYATVVGIFEGLTKIGAPLTVTGNGEQRRDFTHVDDIVSGFVALGQKDWSDQASTLIFNIGTGKNYSINELARMFGGEIEYVPARPGEAQVTLADNSALKEHTDWKQGRTLEKYVSDFLLNCKDGPEDDTVMKWNLLNKIRQAFHS